VLDAAPNKRERKELEKERNGMRKKKKEME
jgi:hypothetical protein